MGFYITFIVINLLVFIGFIIAIYHSDTKGEKFELLSYLIINVITLIMLFSSLYDVKHHVQIYCKEYSIETVIKQFENKSDTTYVLHLRR